MSQIRMALTQKNIAELSWTGIGQIGSVLLGILTIKIITMVGPEEYGLFVLAASLTGMISMAYFGPLEQGFVRYYFDFSRDPRRRSMYLSFLKKTLLLSTAGFLLLALSTMFLSEQFGVGYPFWAAAAFMVVLSASSVPITGMLNAFRLRKEVAFTQLGEKVLTLTMLGGLFFTGAVTIPKVMACIALSAACWFVVRLKIYEKSAGPNEVLSRDVQADKDKLVSEVLRRVTSYSLPFVGWGLISWIQLSGERWIMGGLLSSSDVGRYGLGATLIQSSAVVAFNVLSQYATPIIYEKYSDPNPHMQQQAFGIIKACGWITIGLFLMSGLLFFFVGEEIIGIVSSREFAIEPEMLLVLTLGLGFFYVGQMMTSAGLAAQRPQIYMVPKIITAVLSLGAYTVGCMMAGVQGIVIAVFVINALYAGLIAWTNRRHQVFPTARR